MTIKAHISCTQKNNNKKIFINFKIKRRIMPKMLTFSRFQCVTIAMIELHRRVNSDVYFDPCLVTAMYIMKLLLEKL